MLEYTNDIKMFDWELIGPNIIVYQYNETNVMHFYSVY
jgi:hypothetical protein